MKKIFILIFIFISFIIISGCSKDNSISNISYNEFNDKINNKESFILEVVQTGCSHCEEFSPRFENILNDNNLSAYSINLKEISEKDYKKFNDKFVIDGTPTVIFINKGKETSTMFRINGSVSDDKIISKLKSNNYIK